MCIPGNEQWRDKVVRIKGILKGGQPRDIFAVLIGAGQYVNHYQSIKRAPNASLVLDARKGFSFGALSRYATHTNKRGIGPGMEILVNYGAQYDLSCGEYWRAGASIKEAQPWVSVIPPSLKTRMEEEPKKNEEEAPKKRKAESIHAVAYEELQARWEAEGRDGQARSAVIKKRYKSFALTLR